MASLNCTSLQDSLEFTSSSLKKDPNDLGLLGLEGYVPALLEAWNCNINFTMHEL